MKIEIIKSKTSLEKIKELAKESFGEMVKACVDIKAEIMAVGGELHADSETILIEAGSKQSDLWGINIFPDKKAEPEQVEYTALINIRPSQNNRSMEIKDKAIKGKIQKIVRQLIKWEK